MSERERCLHCDECHCTNRLRHERDWMERERDAHKSRAEKAEAERDEARADFHNCADVGRRLETQLLAVDRETASIRHAALTEAAERVAALRATFVDMRDKHDRGEVIMNTPLGHVDPREALFGPIGVLNTVILSLFKLHEALTPAAGGGDRG